jgi:pyruvate/2-oxoglutarate/acetoin dehydrogenase E1 component
MASIEESDAAGVVAEGSDVTLYGVPDSIVNAVTTAAATGVNATIADASVVDGNSVDGVDGSASSVGQKSTFGIAGKQPDDEDTFFTSPEAGD